MTQRMQAVWAILVGVAGLVVVGAMLLCGKDIAQAVATSPRWRRRLLSAALMLLGIAGLAGCKDQKTQQDPPQITCSDVPSGRLPTTQSNPNLVAHHNALPATFPTTHPTPESIVEDLNLIEKQIAAAQMPRNILEERLDKVAGYAWFFAIAEEKETSTNAGTGKKPNYPLVAAEARASRLWATVHSDPQTPLGRSEDWRAVLAFWHYTQLLAVSNIPEQQSVAVEMEGRAKLGLKALSDTRLLDPAEAQLLSIESERIVQGLTPPFGDRNLMCYVRALISPAKESLERLEARIALLEAALKDGKIDPAVAERVMGTIKSDLAVLSNEKELKELDGGEQTRARAMATRVAATIAKMPSSAGKP